MARPHKKRTKDHTNESRISMAAYLRGRFPKEIVADVYSVILEGKRPKLVRVDKCQHGEHCECGLKVTGDEVYGDKGPTLDHMMLALARIMERSYGQAPQHHILEGEVRAEITAIAAGQESRVIETLSPRALMAIRNAVRGVRAPLPETSDADDAEFVDRPALAAPEDPDAT